MLQTLIVEDELISRIILSTFFRPLGHCDTAQDGTQAIETFSAALMGGTRYDLVCLDINMPGDMNGQAVLRAIRHMEAAAGVAPEDRVKVIMTTGAGDPHSIANAFRSKCDSYLIKPLDKAALKSKLARLGLLA